VVIVLAIGFNIRGLKSGRGRLILRAINVHSKTYFGEDVKRAIPCRKILQHIKDPYSMKEILVGNIHRHFSLSFS
jgi:hypothetical protein